MTLTTLQPYFDTSIATKTAVSVLNRVFVEIKDFANTEEYTEQWIEDSLNILQFSDDIKKGFEHSQCAILSIYREAWDELPLNFRIQYDNQFMEFAKKHTGGKRRSTIDAYTHTARLWILDEYGTGKRIEIKERSAEGRPILNEQGAVITKIVEFCPYNVDFSKLNILNPRAVDDNMTDKLWEMLADPFYTCDDIREEHHKKDEQTGKYEYTMSFSLSGPALICDQNGNTVVIANELNWEGYETDPLVKEAINHLLRLLGAKMDEDVIHEMIHEGFK